MYFVHRFRTRFAAEHVVTVRVASGRVFFSPATRFIAGRVAAVRFPTKRVFSSLSAAFAITLSFFRDRRFTVYKRKLRDK